MHSRVIQEYIFYAFVVALSLIHVLLWGNSSYKFNAFNTRFLYKILIPFDLWYTILKNTLKQKTTDFTAFRLRNKERVSLKKYPSYALV